MKLLITAFGIAALSTLAAVPVAATDPAVANLHFEVLRNGDQIGTMATVVRRDGKDTVAETRTHIRVKMVYVTLYRFDQTETERWADGHFVTLASKTDDNGTVHDVKARAERNIVKVDADGSAKEAGDGAIPASVWNSALVKQAIAVNVTDGSIMKLHAVDHGWEQLEVKGRTVKAHHFTIESSFNQDVWYDEHEQLVKVTLFGSDGSEIEYRPS